MTLNTKAFEIRDDNLYIIGVSTSASGPFKALGQLAQFNVSQQHSSRRYQRVSEGSTEQYGPSTVRVQMSIYLAEGLTDLKRVLGYATTDSEITLDPEKHLYFAVDGYNGTGASATVVQQMKISDMVNMSISGNLTPNGPSVVQISGSAEKYIVIPDPSAALVTV